MFKKIKNISFLVIFFVFIFLVTKYYFSEQNIVFTNKSRSSYLITLRNGQNNLPVLKNDTDDVIVYINDLKYFKNKKKKKILGKINI